ncbi:hypothetical protein ACFLS1_12135 [Verrucomicrobiota bacterium]
MENYNNKQKLYFLGGALYVQYSGRGPRPKEIEEYMAHRNGEAPPYIPLPAGNVEFCIGRGGLHKVRWSVRGRLPEEVMEYVRENGVLPAYNEGKEVRQKPEIY